MKLEDATRYTEKCFNGEPASCSYACPFHLDIRSFLEKVSRGRWVPAYKVLRNAVIFPGIVSVLCDEPCREHCQRTLLGDEALAMLDLEAACIKYAKNTKPEFFAIPPKSERVAVIGAGVSGLACALNLAQKKYSVTVFEKESGWGGKLPNGERLSSHPRFADFDQDIALQFSAVDVEFRYGTEIKSLTELADFDAIYIATGKGGDSFGLLASWDAEMFTTSEPKVFMGGTLCGVSKMEGIAHSVQASKIMEAFLQTGKASLVNAQVYDKKNCERYLKHDGAVSVPRVIASSPDGYTEEEAKKEAARCLLCDCDYCIASCEMLQKFRKKPHKIAVEVATDMQVTGNLASRALTRQTYSCNLCGHCKSVCPEDVDIGALLQSSRTARKNAGGESYPAAFHDFWLREMDFAVSEGFLAATPNGKNECEYAFFPGCQLGAFNPDYVLKSYEFLSSKYDCGILLNCCGAPAYWAGDESLLNENMEKIKQAWNEMGQPTLVFACATCESIFNMFLPEIKRVSLYALLAEEEGISSIRPYDEAVVFDPCNARNNHGLETGVRKLATEAGISLHELKEPNRCCGYGGHIRLANPSLYEEIAQHRAEASDKPYIVYCVNCQDVFARRGKECSHILDLVFDLKKGLKVPTLDQKRANSVEVKKILMKKECGIDFEPETHEWDGLKLLISDEMQKDMENKLISAADLKEAIWQAESSGYKFYNESEGLFMCSMIKPVITYWVQYKEIAPQTYEIVSVYCHRIHFKEEVKQP